MRHLLLIILAIGFAAVAAERMVPKASSWGIPINQWIEIQKQTSIAKLLQNISPNDGAPGSVVASPEGFNPPYRYHWTRDSALAYMTVFHLYQNSSGTQRAALKQKMIDFADFSARLQNTSSLGEPKYELDGQVYAKGWCRPQSDGPALRAISLMQMANEFQSSGDGDISQKHFLPVIAKDIAWVKAHWNETTCDLWEEVYGDHFYTQMVQRRALIEAIPMASKINQNANELLTQANAIGQQLQNHWDAHRGYFVATINWKNGIDYKQSNLDASIILGVLHGHTDDNFLNFSDTRVLATAEKLIQTFHSLYPINQAVGTIGTAIGRYPEDRYAGTNFDGGNPWVLLTAALAQYYYRLSAEYAERGSQKDSSMAFFKAEDLLRRIQLHAPTDGSLSEQMDRHSGYMTSAPDLTWSHSEVIEMFANRPKGSSQTNSRH